MKRRKLKPFVLPVLFLTITLSLFVAIISLGSSFDLTNVNYDYSTSILNEEAEVVTKEEENINTTINSPIDDELANLSIHFYSKDDSEEIQQSSLIYFKNTYLPNKGALYTADVEFPVKTIFEGKVTEISDNEFFGKVLVVEHSKSLKSYYYGLEDIEVSIGDEITSNTILGNSGTNEIMNNKKSFLLEVYYNNELVNPEKIIGTRITDYE